MNTKVLNLIAAVIAFCEAPPVPGPGHPRAETLRVLATPRRFVREGTPWRSLTATPDHASGATLRRSLDLWARTGLLARVHATLVAMLRGDPTLIVDSCSVRVRRGGELVSPNPTDRASSLGRACGSQRSASATSARTVKAAMSAAILARNSRARSVRTERFFEAPPGAPPPAAAQSDRQEAMASILVPSIDTVPSRSSPASRASSRTCRNAASTRPCWLDARSRSCRGRGAGPQRSAS